MNKGRCGSKWSCTKCKVGEQTKESCDENFPSSRTGKHGKDGSLKRNLGRKDIRGELDHEVEKIIHKEHTCVENGKVDFETGKSKSPNSEAGEGVLVDVESTEAMDESSLKGESVEAMEEWLKKN